jgi:hypothetical protein
VVPHMPARIESESVLIWSRNMKFRNETEEMIR